jgi:hypothetical protein
MVTDERDEEFFARLFETGPVKRICGAGFKASPAIEVARPLALSLFSSVMHRNFDPTLRQRCLEAAAELCCEMLLGEAALDGVGDVDTLGAGLSRATDGRRTIRREGDVIHDEIRQPGGRCACPIVGGQDVEEAGLICRACCGRCRELLFGGLLRCIVSAELLATPSCTGSDTCRWLVHLQLE